MGEVRFYHLTASATEDALPKLLEKTLAREKQALVKVLNEDAVHHWNEHLWAYADDSFLPHGSIKDADPQTQPIFITHVDENPANSDYLFLIGGADRQDLTPFDMTAIVFEGHDTATVQWAREKWKAVKQDNITPTYWQQDETGKWQQKG